MLIYALVCSYQTFNISILTLSYVYMQRLYGYTVFLTSEENRMVILLIEIINNTRGGIVMFFTEKKGNAFIGGQIQVPDAGPGADWLS